MVHLFHALDKSMALDVGSGAVHALDPIAFDALALMQGNDVPQDDVIVAELCKTYDEAEAKETVGELRELMRMGYLDTPDDYSEVELTDAGVVKAMCLHAAHDCNLRCK